MTSLPDQSGFDLTFYSYEWSVVSPQGHRRTEPESYARQLGTIPGWHAERRPVAHGEWESVALDEEQR